MLTPIEHFLRKFQGMQLATPGGLTFDLRAVTALEAKSEPHGYLIIHLQGSSVKLTFHRNSRDSGPADIYGLKREIQAAADAA